MILDSLLVAVGGLSFLLCLQILLMKDLGDFLSTCLTAMTLGFLAYQLSL